jgi:hypothetical protein
MDYSLYNPGLPADTLFESSFFSRSALPRAYCPGPVKEALFVMTIISSERYLPFGCLFARKMMKFFTQSTRSREQTDE